MPTLDTEIEDEELDTEVEQEVEVPETEERDATDEPGDDENGSAEEGDKFDVVTLKGEKPEEVEQAAVHGPAPTWVKELRKQVRQQEKELRELRAKAQVPVTQELPPKPKLADYNYDEDKFAAAQEAWLEEKRVKVDEPARRLKEQQEAQDRDYAIRLKKYHQDKQSLKLDNMEEAEEAVKGSFDEMKQGLLVRMEKGASLMYAIGTRPKLLAELSDITDPIDFVVRLARLEDRLNIERKAAPPPEGRAPRAAGTVMGKNAIQQQIDKLEAKFDKGLLSDRTEILKLKRQLNAGNRP